MNGLNKAGWCDGSGCCYADQVSYVRRDIDLSQAMDVRVNID